ncbi:uncharacterized protein A4U43_C06F14090 [Asparagus officinalis]|uniref:Chromo domain-containing protein n=1 Tax=Asparagus officinalis TaxID=4686 RepID=A0A5P1EP89_ASPOF|nr:uncharacterized protein A4U43_C06F14090 [Asparagus officinalis]
MYSCRSESAKELRRLEATTFRVSGWRLCYAEGVTDEGCSVNWQTGKTYTEKHLCDEEHLVKVQWSRKGAEEASWEHEEDMRHDYPYLFEQIK